MRPIGLVPVIGLAFSLLGFMSGAVFSQSGNPSSIPKKSTTIEEVVSAGNKSILEGDWANAESNFREAVRLEADEDLWHIQLLLSLGNQKKWKAAFAELETVIKMFGATDWLLTINKKMPDGKVAFLNTEIFRDEKRGISRYAKAVREAKSVESVARDIGKKLDDFARLHQLALTYDISKLASKRFERGNTIDVTSDFVAYYYERRKD